MGVGLHKGLGMLQGIAARRIAARSDATCQQQQGKEGKTSAHAFHTSICFCREDSKN
jgi:hypothetical protein